MTAPDGPNRRIGYVKLQRQGKSDSRPLTPESTSAFTGQGPQRLLGREGLHWVGNCSSSPLGAVIGGPLIEIARRAIAERPI